MPLSSSATESAGKGSPLIVAEVTVATGCPFSAETTTTKTDSTGMPKIYWVDRNVIDPLFKLNSGSSPIGKSSAAAISTIVSSTSSVLKTATFAVISVAVGVTWTGLIGVLVGLIAVAAGEVLVASGGAGVFVAVAVGGKGVLVAVGKAVAVAVGGSGVLVAVGGSGVGVAVGGRGVLVAVGGNEVSVAAGFVVGVALGINCSVGVADRSRQLTIIMMTIIANSERSRLSGCMFITWRFLPNLSQSRAL